MYSFIRQRINEGNDRTKSLTGSKNGKETYTSHKCRWFLGTLIEGRPR